MTTQTRESTTLTRAKAPPGQATPPETGLPAHGSRSAHRRRFTRHSPAGEVVLAYLDAQAARLSALDLAVRRDKPDAVHQMRVTVRRLRSTLQSFTGICPGPDTEHLRAELKWLGGVLGAARDTEVLADHLHAGLPPCRPSLSSVPRRHGSPRTSPRSRQAAAQAVLDALDSERYRELRAELGRLLDSPPLTPEAAEPAGKVLAARRRRGPTGGRAAGCAAPATRQPGRHATWRCTRRARRPSAPATRRRSPSPRSARRRQEGAPFRQADEGRAVGPRRRTRTR